MDFSIVEGLDHLHTASQNPIIHGNLKTNNIMLDADFQPGISDFGLYLLLNPAAAQEMLETSAMQGYRGTRQLRKKTQFIVYSPVKTQSICLALVALLKIKISRFAWPPDPRKRASCSVSMEGAKASELTHSPGSGTTMMSPAAT